MAKGDIIPDGHHISRYAKTTSIINDEITGSAFSLRSTENSLSVNWLEFFGENNIEINVNNVKQAFIDKRFNLGAGAKFVVLNVLRMREFVSSETEGNVELSVEHDPYPDDPSHSEVLGIPEDDMMVEELLAELITSDAVFPAR